MHDFRTDSTSWNNRAAALIAGILIDDDPVRGVYSEGITIAQNRLQRLTFGPAAIAAYNYQPLGICIAYHESRKHAIRRNHIDVVGEAIAVMGSHCTVSDNHLADAYLFGLNFIHGAQFNEAYANEILRPGIAGVVCSGGKHRDTAFNHIHHNVIKAVNQVTGFVGTRPNADATCLFTEDAPAAAFGSRDNAFDDNACDPGPYCGRIVLRLSRLGGPNAFRRTIVLSEPSIERVGGAEKTGEVSFIPPQPAN
jgi:hypothetical protein